MEMSGSACLYFACYACLYFACYIVFPGRLPRSSSLAIFPGRYRAVDSPRMHYRTGDTARMALDRHDVESP